MLFFVLYSICVFFSLFFFSVVYSTTTGRAGRDITVPTRAAIELQDKMGGGGEATSMCHVPFCSLFCLFLLLTLLLFHYLQYNNRRGWAGRNGANAGGDRNVGQDGRGGSTGTCHVTFLFSALFISSSRSSSFSSLSTVPQQAGPGRTQRDRRGRRNNMGRDRR